MTRRITPAKPGRGHRESRAVVVGGGISGLLAARVLIDHYDAVTIVDRDQFPEEAEFRKGVPQDHHTHYLMIRGKQILEQLFPGFEAEMVAAGAHAVDLSANMVWVNRVGVAPRFRSGLRTFFCSRSLIEWGVRRRLRATGKICFVENCDVVGLLPSPSGRGVAGVQQRFRPGASGVAATIGALAADLVVDASGSRSRAPQWLGELGYRVPPEVVVNPYRGYATRYYAIPADLDVDWKVLILQGRPPHGTRFGQMFPIEGGRWQLTLIGAARDYPPTNEAGFLAFARSLPSPLIYEAIKDAEPVSPIYGYQHTANCMRPYAEMATWPAGFVALGDSVSTLNPSYAQGITAAGLGALTLERCLRRSLRRAGWERRFQQALAATNAPLWSKSIADDLRYAQTKGARRTWRVRFIQWYLDQTLRLALENHDAYKAFVSWMQLIAPLHTLFFPRVAISVLRRALQQRATPSPVPTAAATGAERALSNGEQRT